MNMVDMWFLALYQGLAEPTPMEDGGHRVEDLPDRGEEHEVIEDLNHPLLAATVGISMDGKLVPKRVLNQQDLASLWHVYDLEKIAEDKVSRDVHESFQQTLEEDSGFQRRRTRCQMQCLCRL